MISWCRSLSSFWTMQPRGYFCIAPMMIVLSGNRRLLLRRSRGNIAHAPSRNGNHHKDPADRIIIAAALESNLVVVTADHRFPEYGVTTIC